MMTLFSNSILLPVAIRILYSDGIGRTGTFCTLISMLCRHRLLTEHMADVFYTIYKHKDHAGMVEKSPNYIELCMLN